MWGGDMGRSTDDRAVPHAMLVQRLLASTLIITCCATVAAAQDNAPVDLEEVTVTADRFGATRETLTRKVTVLTRSEIEKQAATGQTLSDMLAKTVPGMAPSSGVFTNFNQTLRGREVLVVVDGVPQKLNRNASRDLFNIDASAIESIEVIHGGSALYGGGAAGGVIFIKTLRGDGAPQMTSKVTAGSSLTRLSEEGVFGGIEHSGSGTIGNTSYAFAVSSEARRGAFDAHGQRIAPEPSQGDLYDTFSGNLFGRLGYDFGDQRVGASINFRSLGQDTDYASDSSVARLAPGSASARALKGLQLDRQGMLRNLQTTLDYSHSDIWGSAFSAQLYARDYTTRFYPFDGRRIPTWNAIAQTFVESRVYGGSATFDTPLPTPSEAVRLRLLWGSDLELESTAMPVYTYDGHAFDASGGTRFLRTGERTFMPRTKFDKYAVFAQLEMLAFDRLTIRGGLRQQWIDVSVNDFVTLGQQNHIQGGTIDYSGALPNVGLNFAASESVNIYADYSRAFELPDIGLQLRFAPRNFRFAASNLEPVVTDNFEVGVRGNWGAMSGSIAAFYSTSDLGPPRIENFRLVPNRDPERIAGVEAAVRHALNEQWAIGGSATWLTGERHDQVLDRWVALNSFRVPPFKLTGFVEYKPTAWWSLRFQGLYSGTRDDAFKDGVGFGGRQVTDYAVFDVYSSFALGRGKLEIGIENLFNSDYFSVNSQLLRSGNNTSYIPASGTTFKAAYSVTW